MKKNVTTAMLGLAYLALGLSMSANSTDELTFVEALPNLSYESVEINDCPEELCDKDSAELAAFYNSNPRDTNEVKVEIEGVDPESGLIEAITEIVTMSTTEATKLAAQIAEIEALVEAGTLTEEEGGARIEELEKSFEAKMESFGESMEAWGEEFGLRMDAWGEEFGKKWEDRAEELEKSIEDGVASDLDIKLDFDQEAPEIPEAPKKKKKSNKTKFDSFEFHMGANSFRTMQGEATMTEDVLNHWESINTRAVFNNKRKIGGAASPLLLSSGVALEILGFSFNNNNTISKVEQPTGPSTTEIVPITGMTDVRRNRFDQVYVEIPAMLELDFSPRGKVDKSLSVGFGGYAGVRLTSQNLALGSDSEGDRLQVVTNSNYNTHLFRYGLQAQLGLKGWKVTGRLDARTFFQKDAFNEDVYVGSLTLGYAF